MRDCQAVRSRVQACIGGVFVSVGCMFASPLRAWDVELDTKTTFDVHDIGSPRSGVLLRQRRLYQGVTLGAYSRVFGREESPLVSVVGALALSHDFGESCVLDSGACYTATASSDPFRHDVFGDGSILELPYLWLDVSALPGGVSFRLGRQLRWDPVGPLRFDGAAAQYRPYEWLKLEFYGGLRTTRTSLLGDDDPGRTVDRVRDDLLAAEHAGHFAAREELAPVFGVGATLGGPSLLLGATFRSQWNGRDLHEQLVGLRVHRQWSQTLSTGASGVLDALRPQRPDVGAQVEWAGPLTPARVTLRYDRRVPRFDPSSIWAYFEVAPVHAVSASTRVPLGSTLTLDARAGLQVFEMTQGEVLESDSELGATLDWRMTRTHASWFLETGELGLRTGGKLGVAARYGDLLRARVVATVWHLDSSPMTSIAGLGTTATVSAGWSIASGINLECLVGVAHIQNDTDWQFSAVFTRGAW